MKTASRIYELTDLRAIAIFLLFFVHSNLHLNEPIFALELEKWMLSAFFFVSGYLTFNNANRTTIKNFFAHRFATLYIPFVLIMVFYVLIAHDSSLALLSCASFLSLFYVFSTGAYFIYQFWFVPMLLGFTVFFVLLYKYVKNDVIRLLILFGLFAFNLINYAFVTSLRFNWDFGLYVLVFAIGYEVANKNILQKLRTLKASLILMATATVTQVLNQEFVVYSWNQTTDIGRLYYYSCYWIGNTVFSVSSLILLLTLLYYKRKNWPKMKVYSILGILGSCSLYIYLLEPYISEKVDLFIFRTTIDYSLSGSLLFVSVLIRLLTVIPVAYGIQKLHNKTERTFENRAHLAKKIQQPNQLR